MDIPGIDVLIHHQDSHFIACSKNGLRAWVVSTAHCIIAVFLHESDLSVVRELMSGCSEDTIVMVNACAPEYHSFSIDGKAFFSIEFKGSDSDTFSSDIITKTYLKVIKLRIFGAPKFCFWKLHGNLSYTIGVSYFFYLCIKFCYGACHLAFRVCTNRSLYHRRIY